MLESFNPLNANPTKWSNTLKQFVGKLPANCLIVFDQFVGLALKGLSNLIMYKTAKSLSLIRLGFLRVNFPGGEVNWIPLLFQEDLGPAHMEVSWPAWAG